MGIVMFNGTSSQDLHALVQTAPEYEFPEKDYSATHVPGRNGDIVIDEGSWKNVPRTYNLAIDTRKISYAEVASKLVQWLHSASGYARLEDSYEPDFYRMAMYKDSGSISNIYSKAGQIEISFDCKPQRFLKSGDESYSIKQPSIIYRNPMGFASEPKLIIHGNGSGSIKIGEYTIDVKDILDGMTIDCEVKDTYYNNTNCNAKVKIQEYPLIIPGDNQISYSGGITSIDIIPRWWTL